MNRGDIVLVQLPRPAGPSGREQFGTRPAVIVQSDTDSTSLSTVLLGPLTSRLSAARFPGSFTVPATDANGLNVESVVLTHQLRAIDRRRIEQVVGRLAHDHMATLESEIRGLLSL
ncbi:MAG: type II toxin-antitoxin system PemK/MazF family toxin [Planctomycetota bacterium]